MSRNWGRPSPALASLEIQSLMLLQWLSSRSIIGVAVIVATVSKCRRWTADVVMWSGLSLAIVRVEQ